MMMTLLSNMRVVPKKYIEVFMKNEIHKKRIFIMIEY